ncbi:hypothetical protein [Pedobacter faecalis]|uniref:hypothetical protein n=1 Tax=Pedobacter faecalis TaxID=3041495 RepID=UPI00254E82C0|nr:hypothetical protein [Pedobacter sp. ELA7]
MTEGIAGIACILMPIVCSLSEAEDGFISDVRTSFFLTEVEPRKEYKDGHDDGQRFHITKLIS